MRVRITKLATISQQTQTTYAADLTAPVLTGPSRKPPPSRWERLLERVRKLLHRYQGSAPAASAPGWEGTLVEFRGFEGTGADKRVVYNPFPKTADQCVDFDKPVVLLLDSERVGDRPRLWFTSPVQMVYGSEEGLPVRVDTRSSSYRLEWLDKPAELPEQDGRVRG